MRDHETTHFIIVRHAQTAWNVEKRIQGSEADPSLTPKGREDALAWGRILKAHQVDRIVSSPLLRAMETARIINESLNVPMSEDDRFCEQAWGGWSGKTLAQVKSQSKDLLRQMEAKGWEFTPPYGESRIQVLKRTTQGIEKAHEKWPGQTVLLVVHSGVIKCLLYHLLGRAFLPSEPSCLLPDHVHRIVFGRSGMALDALNFIPLAP